MVEALELLGQLVVGIGLGDRLGRHGDGVVAPDLLPELPVVDVDGVRIDRGRLREARELLLGLLIPASLLKLLLDLLCGQESGCLARVLRLVAGVGQPALELEQLVALGAQGLEIWHRSRSDGRWLDRLLRLHQTLLHAGDGRGDGPRFLTAPLGDLVDDRQADDGVDHLLALGRLHGAELLDVTLVRHAGGVEDVEAEAQDLDHLRVGALDAVGDLLVTAEQLGRGDRALGPIGLPADGELQLHLQVLVVVGLSAESGRAEQREPDHLQDDGLAGLVRAGDGAEALLELVVAGERPTGGRKRDSEFQSGQHWHFPCVRAFVTALMTAGAACRANSRASSRNAASPAAAAFLSSWISAVSGSVRPSVASHSSMAATSCASFGNAGGLETVGDLFSDFLGHVGLLEGLGEQRHEVEVAQRHLVLILFGVAAVPLEAELQAVDRFGEDLTALQEHADALVGQILALHLLRPERDIHLAIVLAVGVGLHGADLDHLRRRPG